MGAVSDSQQSSNRSQIRFLVGLVFLVLLSSVFFVTDWQAIRRAILAMEWEPIPAAILATVISYTCISYSFALVSRSFGKVSAGRAELAAIGFVTTVINHVVTSGGAVGYSLRYVLMKQRGMGMKKVFTVSVLHFYLTSMVMLGMLPIALIVLFSNTNLPRGLALSIVAAAIIVILAFLFMTILVFSESIRSRFVNVLSRWAQTVTQRFSGMAIEDLHTSLSSGVRILRDRPGRGAAIFALIAVDWMTSAAALWFCFKALGEPLAPHVLMTGFVIGILTGVISMIPGGVGVQEGSMAGVFSLLGVPIEEALLAAILFRLVYYLLPYLAALGIFARISHPGSVPAVGTRE